MKYKRYAELASIQYNFAGLLLYILGSSPLPFSLTRLTTKVLQASPMQYYLFYATHDQTILTFCMTEPS